MPRDGSGIYTTPPGTTAVPDTTIESTKYNNNVADVATDLNAARPVIAGGTGATNALDARAALGAEVASPAVVITNFDSHVYTSGTYYSNPGATAAPNSIDPYVVTAIMHANTAYGIVYAINVNTGAEWQRLKVAGVWQAWVQMVTSLATMDGRFVNATGDTMTGNLNINKADPLLVLQGTGIGAVTAANASGNAFWQMRFSEGAPATANFALYRFNDSNVVIENALNIDRLTGVVTIPKQIKGAVNPLITHSGNAGYAAWSTAAGAGAWGFWAAAATNRMELGVVDGNGTPTGGTLTISASSLTSLSTQAYKPGGGAWADSSDARVKNVIGAYTHGLAELQQIEPVRFTFKGNVQRTDPALDTTAKADHHNALGEEFVGVIAQDIEGPMPETVKKISAFIDGVAVDDVRLLDPSALTYALINAVKELAARIEALEGAAR
jgi:hypothetical protein